MISLFMILSDEQIAEKYRKVTEVVGHSHDLDPNIAMLLGILVGIIVILAARPR